MSASSTGVRARLRTVPLPVLLGGMLVAGLCLLLTLNTASAAQELRQRELTDSNANASDLEQQLVRDLASRQAPAALASAAAAQGLVPNPNPAFLRINSDGSVTVLGSPTPASVVAVPATPSASPSASKSAGPTASASGRPTAGKPASSRSSGAPVVTVTVTKSAPRPSPTPSPTGSASRRPTGSTSPTPSNGGHR
jgi:hypothetical protein